MPAGAVYVGRPSRWGNPFVGCGDGTIDRGAAVRRFRKWLDGYDRPMTQPSGKDMEMLRGKDLACWCRLDQPCHADVLLELVNR